MADPPPGRTSSSTHLNLSGSQEVVFCHQCENEWYKEEFGLTCPRCHGEATEIVTADNDPRGRESSPDTLEDLHPLHDHNPWLEDDDVPDPDEGDVEEYIAHGPGGHTTFFSQTFTTRGSRGPAGNPRNRRPPTDPDDPANVIRDFHSMMGQFMGSNLRPGRAGRSGPEALFSRGEPEPFRRTHTGGRMAHGGMDGPHIVGHRFTWTTGGRQPTADPEAQDIAAEDIATYASPVPPRSASGPSFLVISIRARPDQLASILGRLFNSMGPLGQIQNPEGEPNGQRGNMPLGLQGLFATLLNPANAVAGDAVYSQEALDRIISALMEQHPQSNAPGPASQEAIASLPKKNLDEKMLGPELKAECSVCMDDVTVGDEVVVLPCKHWFHEACASAWLNEHNTCPICRTGIGGEQPPPLPQRASQHDPSPVPMDEVRFRRTSYRRPSVNEARLSGIRDRGRLSPTSPGSSRRYQFVGDSTRSRNRTPSPPSMPGGYGTSFRRRDSEISENQREARRNTSGSDRSHRSSNSGNAGESGGSGGPMAWFRRFGRRQE